LAVYIILSMMHGHTNIKFKSLTICQWYRTMELTYNNIKYTFVVVGNATLFLDCWQKWNDINQFKWLSL